MRSRRRRHRFELNADVNVVSLIDVMLLLLVIFMITAPMMQGGIDLNLPKADAPPMEAKDALEIEIHRDGRIKVEGNVISLRDFRVAAKSYAGTRARGGVYLRVDRSVPYDEVDQVLVILRNAAITNVSFVMEPEEIR